MEHAIYIGKWPDCGCVTAACVDDPKHAKDTAQFLKDVAASGRIIERIQPENWGTIHLSRCIHREKSGRVIKAMGNPEVCLELFTK